MPGANTSRFKQKDTGSANADMGDEVHDKSLKSQTVQHASENRRISYRSVVRVLSLGVAKAFIVRVTLHTRRRVLLHDRHDFVENTTCATSGTI